MLLRLFLNSSPAGIKKIINLGYRFYTSCNRCVLFLYRTNGLVYGPLLFVLLPLFMRLKGLLQQIRNFTKTARGPSEGQKLICSNGVFRDELGSRQWQMTGTVKKGRFAGNQLEALNLEQLVQLLNEAEGDPKTVALPRKLFRDQLWSGMGQPKATNESDIHSSK